MKLFYKNRLFLFILISTGFAWIIWLPEILYIREIIPLPFDPAIMRPVGAFAPLIAAFILSKGENWKKKDLLIRLIRFPQKSEGWILSWIAPLCIFIAVIVSVRLFDSDFHAGVVETPFGAVVSFFMIFLFGGPLAIELSFRGFFSDLLNEKLDPFFTMVVVGLFWSVWQAPLAFIPGTFSSMIGFIPFTGIFISLSIILGIQVRLSSGGVGGSMISHALVNLTYAFLPVFMIQHAVTLYLSLLVLSACIVSTKHRAYLFPSESKMFR